MPLVSPVMHHVNLYAHAFFVPNRLLMAPGKWEEFITGQTEDLLPTWTPDFFQSEGQSLVAEGSLVDHLNFGDWYGKNTNPFIGKPLSQLSLRAYQKIWND